MKIHIRLYIIGAFLIGLGAILFVHQSGAQEKNQQAYDVACEVTDVETLKDCVQKAKNKEVDLIKIMKMITCTSKEDCAIDLSSISHPIKMYGVNLDTGFKRIQNFDYSLFTIKGSKDIVIGSFLVDDSGDGGCASLGSPCPPVVMIANSDTITIDQLRTLSSKNIAIFVENTSTITVKNSIISGSGAAGLWIATNGGSNLISNNQFIGNHKTSFYEGCTGICTAAQIYIVPNTKLLTVSQNTIKDGHIAVYDALGLYASGIDIAGENVEGVKISCNKIYNNSGNGIVINEQASTKDITIDKNSIYGNGIDINVTNSPQNTVENNCVGSACRVAGC